MDPYTILYIFSLVSAMFNVISSKSTYNVLRYGAVGNGHADDTPAFVKAWNAACNDKSTPTIIIPEGKIFLVYPTNLVGPCKSSNINVVLSGKIIAPENPSDWKGKNLERWLAFRYVNGLTVTGNGALDGRGKRWWDISCKYNPGKNCNKVAPTILRFELCKNVHLRGISTMQSGGGHLVIYGCENVEFASLNLQSPAKSPNTDGIHVSHSHSVSIHDSVIGTGDDCISMLDRTYNINITSIDCGPGHGISIGSLGANGEEVDVQNIAISHINFHSTTNGGRIKTWQAGRGKVQNIQFSNIRLTEVANPIIIDQHYGEPKNSPPKKYKTGVHISDVQYSGFFGTSKTQVAINLNCSDNVPCTNLSLENIKLKYGASGRKATSSCNNAYGSADGIVEPKSCLRNN